MMRITKMFCAVCALLFCMTAVMAADAAKPKYVFLFIGDGMSIPQRMMAEQFQTLNGNPGLAINSFPYQVMTTTKSANSFITDSAAGGTAIACGSKTNNGAIGVDANGERLTSTAEVARDAGKKVGIITSVTLNHATPAAFYGHNNSRGAGYALGLDLIASNFDFFGGGGLDGHNDTKADGYKGDVYALAQEAGYLVTHDKDELAALTPGCGKVLACREEGALPYAIDDNSGPRDKDYLAKAIELLDNENGFFIMTEGGKIDWMCHANDAGTTMREIVDLDAAVQVAVDFAKQHQNETLIVVTGDHETGGLTLGFAGTGYESFIERLQNQTCSKEKFSEKLTALANGKTGEEKVTFEEVMPLITESFGLQFSDNKEDPMRLHTAEREELKKAFETSFLGEKIKVKPLANKTVEIFDHKAGLAWTSGAHTALPVNTSAYGVGADQFQGMIDNTDIAKKLKELVK